MHGKHGKNQTQTPNSQHSLDPAGLPSPTMSQTKVLIAYVGSDHQQDAVQLVQVLLPQPKTGAQCC
jgi:hypothetical protein